MPPARDVRDDARGDVRDMDEAGGQDFAEIGRRLFAGEAGFVFAADRIDGLPPMKGVEIAFAGRSNVGKSSLVNALTGRRTLARTSHTPGRTQQLNFFEIGTPQGGSGDGGLTLVDMPGYGYAAVSQQKVQAWTRLIHAYLRGRANLARVFLLIDARHGLKDTDGPVLETLDQAAVSYQVVLTKSDALGPGQLAARVAEVGAGLARHAAAFPEVLPTSGRTGAGVEALRAAVARLLAERA